MHNIVGDNLKLVKLTLNKIRCFDHFELEFDNPTASSSTSTLLVGDNGDGKTTILRSLALGLCDESSAAALFRELPGEFVKRERGMDKGSIEIKLAAGGGYHYKTVTTITALDTFERVTQKVFRIRGNKTEKLEQDTFPWEKIFVSGYGAGNRTQGTADFEHYLAVDAVYPLFNYTSPLQNPELGVRRLVDEAESIAQKSTRKFAESRNKVLYDIRTLLSNIVNLGHEDTVDLTRTGIGIFRGKRFYELKTLGDGYRSTITWVIDLLAWWMLYTHSTKTRTTLNTMDGIVLIDEIEQHLHPRWQSNIIQLLRESFPNVQFIASTHSPLILSSDQNIDVHILNNGNHQTFKPYGWLAEDIYRVMGLETSRNADFRLALDEYDKLYIKSISKKKLSAKDKSKLKELESKIDKLPGSDPTLTISKLNALRNSFKLKK